MEQFLSYFTDLPPIAAYAVVFAVLLACGLGLPIPEDITLIFGGYLASENLANVWVMIVVSYFGVMLGDSIIFWLGARFGRRLVRRPFFHRVLPEERLQYVQAKFRERGNPLIFVARFMPGLRAPIYFTAGTLHIPFRVFFFYDGMAALLSVPAIVYCAFYFGEYIHNVIFYVRKAEYGILGVVAVLAIVIALKWYRSQKKVNSESL